MFDPTDLRLWATVLIVAGWCLGSSEARAQSAGEFRSKAYRAAVSMPRDASVVPRPAARTVQPAGGHPPAAPAATTSAPPSRYGISLTRTAFEVPAAPPVGNLAPPLVQPAAMQQTQLAPNELRTGPPEPPATPPAPPEQPAAGDRPKSQLQELVERPGTPIDLGSALQLAGVRTPNIQTARLRVVEAVIERQLAAAQFLPALRAGTNYDLHMGAYQQSSGNVLRVNRSALFVGAGANAVAAGTVGIPGVGLTLNIAETIYRNLRARQAVEAQQFTDRARENEMLRQVAIAYAELLRAEGQRALTRRTLEELDGVLELTESHARAGTGRQADFERAATNLQRRAIDVTAADYGAVSASAQLTELLNLDPTMRLEPTEAFVVPMPLVPDPIPVRELLAIAITNRPELAAQQATIRQAMLTLDGAKMLPFSPNVILMYSSGSFGGGSDIVNGTRVPDIAREEILSDGTAFGARVNQQRFGQFAVREDFDAIAYWSLLNMGLGNLGQIKVARSQLQQEDLEKVRVLNQVRREVTEAYVRTHTRFAQIEANERAVRTAYEAFTEDVTRIRGLVGRPIETLTSLRVLAQARQDYLNAIVDYNRAQVDLFVALGQPPANTLARPVPKDVPPQAEVAPPPAPAAGPVQGPQ